MGAMDKTRIVILILSFNIIAKFSLVQTDFFMPCVERRNITIVPYTGGPEYKVPHISRQTIRNAYVNKIAFLLRDLLEDPCFTVYVYCYLKKRCIRQTKNIIANLETHIHIQTDSSYHNVNIARILTDIPPASNHGAKQTLLLIQIDPNPPYERKRQMAISEIIETEHKFKKFDAVLLGLRRTPLQAELTKWMPRQNILVFKYFDFNQHIHHIMLDLMRNPQYNWFDRYTQDIKNRCRNLSESHIYLWHLKFFSRESDSFFMSDMLNNYFLDLPNVTVYEGEINISPKTEGKLYIMPFDSTFNVRSHWLEISEWKPKNKNVTNVNIVFDEKPYSIDIKHPLENMIQVMVNNHIPESPSFQNGKIRIWTHDITSPMFFKMLMEKVYSILCIV